jgi:hypothetical protein
MMRAFTNNDNSDNEHTSMSWVTVTVTAMQQQVEKLNTFSYSYDSCTIIITTSFITSRTLYAMRTLRCTARERVQAFERSTTIITRERVSRAREKSHSHVNNPEPISSQAKSQVQCSKAVIFLCCWSFCIRTTNTSLLSS